MGRHLRAAQWVQAIVDYHGKSVEDFAELADMSRGGVNKLIYGQQYPRHDSIEKLEAVAPPTLKDFKAWMRGDTPPMSESDRTVPANLKEGAYVTQSRDAAMVAQDIDAIEDKALRTRARNAALKAIEEVLHPSMLDAEIGPGRAQRR